MNQPRTFRQAAIALGWVKKEDSEAAQRTAEMRLRRMVLENVAAGAHDPRFHLGKWKEKAHPIWYMTLERLYDCCPQIRPKNYRMEVNPRVLVTRMAEVAESKVDEAMAEVRPVVTRCNALLQEVADRLGGPTAAFGLSTGHTGRVERRVGRPPKTPKEPPSTPSPYPWLKQG